jgi:hypothetical protein
MSLEFLKMYKTRNFSKKRIGSKLFKNHKMFHIHGNSACGDTMYEGKKLPNVIECTLVRNDLISDYELDNSTIPDPNFDNINNENTREISFTLN